MDQKSENQLTVECIMEQRNNALNVVAMLTAKLELAQREIERLTPPTEAA